MIPREPSSETHDEAYLLPRTTMSKDEIKERGGRARIKSHGFRVCDDANRIKHC
jgi:hypothetical protein